VARTIHQSVNLAEVLEDAVEVMSKNIDGVDNVSIYLVEGEEAVLKAYRGYPSWWIKKVSRIPYPKGFTWKVIMEGKPRYVTDVDQDMVIGPAGREMGTKSYVSMPINHEGKTIGVININSLKKNVFNEEELKLLEAVARQIEIAINNARLVESIRGGEERLQAILKNEPECVKVVAPDGTLVEMNPAGINMIEADSVEMVIGKSIYPIVAPEHREAFRRLMEEVFQGHTGTLEFEIIGLKGTRRWLETHAVPLRNERNEVISLLSITRDVTERKLAQDRIKEQAALLDRSQDAIGVRDMEHRIIYWNKSAERLYGWKAEEAIGKNANELLYRKGSPELTEAQKIVMERGEWIGELPQVTRDGREVIVESRWTLMRDSNGTPKSILIVNTDITEKKKLEAQFLRAQRLESIGTLAGGIAHDLNNVLTPIMMALQLLRQKFTDEQSKSWLDTLDASVQRGADLIKQVLAFARGSEGVHTPIRFGDLISETKSILLETFPKSIEIKTDIPKDLWLISGEKTQLNQVLMNLCVNARDAMPNGGRLSISAENFFIDDSYAIINIEAKTGPYIVVTVSDTGIGIPPGHLEKIFDPFFTTKGAGKGTGLGLSTAYRIVKDHGGFINVRSEVGKGTSFKVYLPAIETTETLDREKKKTEELPPGKGQLILVVDDENSICEITRVTLEAHGYNVITANDGAEAVALYAQDAEKIEAVILDMVMPIMDGPETIRALLTIDPRAKIIAASGLMERNILTRIRETDVSAFLSKPYTADTLLNTLHEVLSAK
jgi:PAS domain S-box-containing protein